MHEKEVANRCIWIAIKCFKWAKYLRSRVRFTQSRWKHLSSFLCMSVALVICCKTSKTWFYRLSFVSNAYRESEKIMLEYSEWDPAESIPLLLIKRIQNHRSNAKYAYSVRIKLLSESIFGQYNYSLLIYLSGNDFFKNQESLNKQYVHLSKR